MTAATKKAPAKASTKTAPKAAAQAEPKAPAPAAETRPDPTADPRQAPMPGAAPSDPQTSAEAIEQRKAAPHAPAVVGGPGSVADADEATPVAFAPVEYPANPAAVDNQMTLESRQRAKLVGDSVARATATVGRGTAQAGAVEFTSVRRPARTTIAEPEMEEEPVARIAAVGGQTLQFTAKAGGLVEISLYRPQQLNALSGPPVNEVLAVLDQAQWDALDGLKLSTAEAAAAQSAAEQRAGVATEGGDPGPAAPEPIRL